MNPLRFPFIQDNLVKINNADYFISIDAKNTSGSYKKQVNTNCIWQFEQSDTIQNTYNNHSGAMQNKSFWAKNDKYYLLINPEELNFSHLLNNLNYKVNLDINSHDDSTIPGLVFKIENNVLTILQSNNSILLCYDPYHNTTNENMFNFCNKVFVDHNNFLTFVSVPDLVTQIISYNKDEIKLVYNSVLYTFNLITGSYMIDLEDILILVSQEKISLSKVINDEEVNAFITLQHNVSLEDQVYNAYLSFR